MYLRVYRNQCLLPSPIVIIVKHIDKYCNHQRRRRRLQRCLRCKKANLPFRLTRLKHICTYIYINTFFPST